jgi:hypothetical protein
MLLLLDSSTLTDLPKVSSCISKLFRNREISGYSPCLGVVGDKLFCFVCLLSPHHHAGSVRFIFVLLHKRWRTIKWDSIWCQLFTADKFLFLFIQLLLFLTPWCNSPYGPGPPHQGTTITLRHTTLGRSPLDEWSAWYRDLYLTTQHSQTDIHAPGGIRTRNPRKSAAFGLLGHWDWLIVSYCDIYVLYCNWNSCPLPQFLYDIWVWGRVKCSTLC